MRPDYSAISGTNDLVIDEEVQGTGSRVLSFNLYPPSSRSRRGERAIFMELVWGQPPSPSTFVRDKFPELLSLFWTENFL